jgi:hypothetical protein
VRKWRLTFVSQDERDFARTAPTSGQPPHALLQMDTFDVAGAGDGVMEGAP